MSARMIELLMDEVTIKNGRALIEYLQCRGFLHRERVCSNCMVFMVLKPYKKNKDGFAWRCVTSSCSKFLEYESVRLNSFFEDFTLSFKKIFKIVCGYACRQQRHSILRSVDISEPTLHKVVKKIVGFIPNTDFQNNKLGGPGKVVQVDETMLNFKCKSHRGRSPGNRTDSLCIVECEERILRAFAIIIPNKRQETIVPIICSQVASGSVVNTDEHGAYFNLRSYGFIHGTVCHKYNFVDRGTGINTQGIESFHNELKIEIKKRKGVKTIDREAFLREFCFYFNNRENFDEVILNLIKVS